MNFRSGIEQWGGLGPAYEGWRPSTPVWAFEEGAIKYGEWKLNSAGPDRTASYLGGTDVNFIMDEIIYDPSNGTVSSGDIVRCQKEPEVTESP